MNLTPLEHYWKQVFDRSSVEQEQDYAVSLWSEHGLRRRLIQCGTICDQLRSSLRGVSVLDAGCGPASYGKQLVSAGFRVAAVDYSQNMVRRAVQNVSHLDAGQRNLIHFSVADVRSLPLRENTFDLIVCFGVMQHLGDVLPPMSEFFRVSKPGGYCIINTLSSRFLYRRRKQNLRMQDPFVFEGICRSIGFESIQLLPMLLLPRPVRFLELLDRSPIIRWALWTIAHDFTLVLKKP